MPRHWSGAERLAEIPQHNQTPMEVIRSVIHYKSAEAAAAAAGTAAAVAAAGAAGTAAAAAAAAAAAGTAAAEAVAAAADGAAGTAAAASLVTGYFITHCLSTSGANQVNCCPLRAILGHHSGHLTSHATIATTSQHFGHHIDPPPYGPPTSAESSNFTLTRSLLRTLTTSPVIL